jgi:hypothetical protein
MTDDPRIVDFVLGALPAEERATVNLKRLHDAALDRDIELLELSLGAMAPIGNAEVGSALWARISSALELERREFTGIELGCFTDGDWERLCPDIEAKMLWNDRTHLLRCQPGAAETEHLQEDDEHVVLIAGDLVIGGRVLSTGDHLFFPTGGRHPAMRTAQGCILLVHHCDQMPK